MMQPTAKKNCTTCAHFRKAKLAAEGWHCDLFTRNELVSDGYSPPEGGEAALAEFVCDDWEPP